MWVCSAVTVTLLSSVYVNSRWCALLRYGAIILIAFNWPFLFCRVYTSSPRQKPAVTLLTTANGRYSRRCLNKAKCFSSPRYQLGLTSTAQGTASVIKNICVGNKMAKEPFTLTCAVRANGFYFSLWNEIAPPFQYTVWANEWSRRAVLKTV